MKPIKVCFISLRSYPLFTKKSLDYFGGAEVQISLITRELAKDKRFRVSLITGDYGQPPVINRNRLKIYKTKLWDFFKILKLVNADIYIERTVNPKIIPVYLFCRFFRNKFIYMAAHDWDLNHRVIKLADLIIAQHRQQQTSLNDHSLVMPPLMKIAKTKKSYRRQYILWVGRADDWKRPADFIRLARKYPQEKFVMICRPGQIKFSPPSLPNLKFYAAVSFNDIGRFFRQAKILVNTSTAEGWPNTFLQAGAAKTPVLSFKVNPDKYIIKYHCGLVGRARLESMLSNPARLKSMGQNHYNYVKKHHNLKNLNVFKKALLEI